jgi:hypothetical protein
MKKLGWERRQIRVALLVIGLFAVFQFLVWNMAFR